MTDWDLLLNGLITVGGIVFAVGAEFVALIRRRSPPPPRRAWELTAGSCRLVALGSDAWLAKGETPAADLRLRFGTLELGEDEYGTTFVVDAPDRWIVPIGLSRETAATGRAKERGAREIETGDDAFDDAFYVTGPEGAVRAVLDHETRRALLGLQVEVDLATVGGELRGRVVSVGSAPPLHALLLSRTLPLILDVARRLRRPADLAARLARNAQQDREPGVRRENLLCLARDAPDAESTRAALRAGCADPSSDVRVRAALALGEEGRPFLLAAARDPEGEDLPTARAVAALGDRLSLDDALTLLAQALRSRHFETAREWLRSLGRRGTAEAVPAMAKVLGVDHGYLAVAAAEALADTGLPEAEPPLLGALERHETEPRRAAVAALGRLGSPAAVLPLREIEKGDRDEAIRRAARQAIAAIQARRPGASAGQLSLAAGDDAGGALSLAQDATGRLSLDDPRRAPRTEGQ